MRFQLKFLFFLVILSLLAVLGMQYFKNGKTLPESVLPQALQVRGAIPYWDQDNAFTSFKNNVNLFTYVSVFWYYLNNEGNIETYQYAKEDKSIIDFAHAHNVRVISTITNLPENGAWDSNERVEEVIDDSSKRAKHIRDIVALTEKLHFDGILIDYEEVNASHKEAFSHFISELADALHQKGKLLAVSLHPKRQNADNAIGAFQDWQVLANAADQLSIMSYGQHYDTSDAGPIASIGWMREIAAYAQSMHIPMKKFFLGLPLDGYDWNKDNDQAAQGVTYADVQQLLQKHGVQPYWNEPAKAPYFFYEQNGNKHEVWFENAKSIGEKIKLAKDVGFGGITFWRLGQEDQNIWSILASLRY